MSDFKAKMHQIRFRLGLRPRPRWGSLQRSPRLPSWISGAYFDTGGEGREKGGEGREGKGEEAFLVMWPRKFSALNPPPSRGLPTRGTVASTEHVISSPCLLVRQ